MNLILNNCSDEINLNLSKKKIKEFDDIFDLKNINNFIINIDLIKNLFTSDYFDNFIKYINIKIKNVVSNTKIFYLHINLKTFEISDLYWYDKILKIANLLHEYTNELKYIFIYESSHLFTNLMTMLSNSLNMDISKKIIFETNSLNNSHI